MKEIIDQFAPIVQRSQKLILEDDGIRKTAKWEIIFLDSTRLVAYESTASISGRSKYNYQWMTTENELIRRWDNNTHYPHIPTHPFHQHDGSTGQVDVSEPMTLGKVLTFVAAHLQLL